MPLIGITTSRISHANAQYSTISLMEAYVRAVSTAGGAPLLIPLGLPLEQLDEIYGRLDGILFSGGGDVAPEVFGGTYHPLVGGVDVDRDRVELYLARAAAQDGRPFLGICRGIQLINVALGGSLYTHIADQNPEPLKHDFFPDWPRDYLAHAVRVDADSRLAHILGATSVSVNSLHHQGLQRLAAGLRPVAAAPDGLVEGVEYANHPFGLAVQWHPEWMQEHAPMRALFKAFVDACAR